MPTEFAPGSPTNREAMTERAKEPTASSILLAPDLAEVVRARRLLAEIAAAAGFGDERIFDITVACSEAAANAIEHAPVKGQVEVRTLLYPDRLEVQIEGSGEFQTPDHLKERSSRGLGLPLMAKLADHLALYSGPRGGTLVGLSFYRPDARREDEDEALPPSIQELIKENELVSKITEIIPVGIYVVDPDLRYRWTNRAYQGFLDEPYRSRDLVGLYLGDVVPGAGEAGLLADLEQASRTGASLAASEQELTGYARGRTWWRRNIIPLIGEADRPPYHLLVVVSEETETKRTEQALSASEESLRRTQEIAHLGSWELDLVTKRLTWSDEVYRIFGLVPQEFGATYEAFLHHVHPDDRAAVDAAYSASVREGRDSYEIEHRVVRAKSGEVRWVQERCLHFRSSEGRVSRSIGMVLDITDRKLAEEALRASEDAVRSRLNSLLSPQGDVGELELGDIIDFSALQSFLADFHELTGIPLAIIDLKGKVLVAAGWSEICTRFHRVHPETYKNCVESDTLLTADVPKGEFRLYRCKNHMWDVATPIYVSDRHVGNIFSGQFFFEDETPGHEVFRSQARRYGFDEGEYLAALEAVPRLNRAAVDAAMAYFTKLAHMLSQLSYSAITLSRSLAQRESLARSLRSANEELRSQAAELASAYEEIAQREERFRVVADFAYDWEHWLSPDGRFIHVSPSVERLTGHKSEEFLADAGLFLRLVHPRDREVVLVHLEALEAGPAELVFRIIRADGEERWIEHACQPVRDAAGGLLGRRGSNRDITERRQAEEALRESESFHRQTLESIPGMVFTTRPDGYCDYQSQQWVDYTGVPMSRHLGSGWNELLHPGDRAAALMAWQRAVQGEAPYDLEYRVRRHDGAYEWFKVVGRPIRSTSGEIVRWFGTALNVEELKRAGDRLRESEERQRAVAEENERLYRQQLDIAESLQLALLSIPSEIGRVRLGHLYRSATEAALVGGDFYDVFGVKDGKIAVLIGDVAGHGIQAARTATLVRDVVHAFTYQTLRTPEVLGRTNGLLVEKDLPGFVTAFLAILDTESGHLSYSSAGHPETLLRRASGEIEPLGSGSPPLGVFPDASWEAGAVELQAGDLLLLYTDGVLEARRNGDFFGQKRLERLLGRKGISVERLPHLVLDQVLSFSGGSLTDDIAILALSLTEAVGESRPGQPFRQEKLLR